jgi:bacterioferritin
MKGDEKVIGYLKDVLKAELAAINQYFLHSRMCANWGYQAMADYMRKESIEEMHHADILIERILFLESVPNLREMDPLRIGKDLKSQLQNDLAIELEAVPRLNEGIKVATEKGDNGSRALFEKILLDEEHHIDWLEGQLQMIEEMGLGNYLSQQMGGHTRGS